MAVCNSRHSNFGRNTIDRRTSYPSVRATGFCANRGRDSRDIKRPGSQRSNVYYPRCCEAGKSCLPHWRVFEDGFSGHVWFKGRQLAEVSGWDKDSSSGLLGKFADCISTKGSSRRVG